MESILKKYDNIKLWDDNSKVVQWSCAGPRGRYGDNIYSKMISKSDADWIIIVDADEFIYAREGYDTIRDFEITVLHGIRSSSYGAGSSKPTRLEDLTICELFLCS